MQNFLPPFILALRETLEAFLLITILLDFLNKTGSQHLKKSVWLGVLVGILISLVFGAALTGFSYYMSSVEAASELWESLASLGALLLVTTFIIWILKERTRFKQNIQEKAALNLSTRGIFFLSFLMLAREGVELSFFAFAGSYELWPLLLGGAFAGFLMVLIHRSIVKIPFKTLFNVTLGYLILQAGFLFGYGLHEGIAALKDLGFLEEKNFLLEPAFDLSKTVFSHKEGLFGVPLYIAFGWHSKPEWIQFIVQYTYTALLFFYWVRTSKGAEAKHQESCVCMYPPFHYLNFQSVPLGMDSTGGNYGEVSFEHCKQCRAIWLRYFMEIEGYEKSGRWYRGLIEPERMEWLTPANALSHLETLKWYFYGGSYFGTSGKKGSGKIIL